MAVNVDSETKMDCILAQADIFVPGSSPELLGIVGTFTVDKVCAEVMAPQKGTNSRVPIGGAIARGYHLVLCIAVTSYTVLVLRLHLCKL